MSITADCELHIIGNLDLHHCRLIIHKFPDGQYDLVYIFPVYLLAVFEPLCHVVNELLRHLVTESYAVVVWLDGHRVYIKTFCSRRRIADLDSGEEVELAHNSLALNELEFGIFVPWVDLRARLEILEGILGSEHGGMGESTAVIGLFNRALSAKGTPLGMMSWSLLQTFTKPGFSSTALVAS